MITIICCNKSCPKGKFDWHVSIDCVPAQFEDPKAVWKKAFCPHCNQLNWVFVTCKRGRRISRRERPITIKGRLITIKRRPISKRGRRISKRGRPIKVQPRRVSQQPEDPGDDGPTVVPVAMTTKGYENRNQSSPEVLDQS